MENNGIDRLFPLQIERIDCEIPKSETLYQSIANSFHNFMDRSHIPQKLYRE